MKSSPRSVVGITPALLQNDPRSSRLGVRRNHGNPPAQVPAELWLGGQTEVLAAAQHQDRAA